jgi:low temperature requirement protein LtrA
MRSRWYHVPVLHTALHPEKKVSWLELFYDLIFVAAIIQLGDALSGEVSLGNFAAFAGHFVPLWIAWSGFTFYVNRFSVDDFTHRLLVFLKMFAVGAMAIAAPDAMRGDHHVFALAYGIAQVMITLMYMRAWRASDDARA